MLIQKYVKSINWWAGSIHPYLIQRLPKTYSWFLNLRSNSSMLAISSAKVGLGP